jgi:hypothetical protein
MGGDVMPGASTAVGASRGASGAAVIEPHYQLAWLRSGC